MGTGSISAFSSARWICIAACFSTRYPGDRGTLYSVLSTGTMTFGPNTFSRNLVYTSQDNSADEPTQHVRLVIESADGIIIVDPDDNSRTVHITDNDWNANAAYPRIINISVPESVGVIDEAILQFDYYGIYYRQFQPLPHSEFSEALSVTMTDVSASSWFDYNPIGGWPATACRRRPMSACGPQPEPSSSMEVPKKS